MRVPGRRHWTETVELFTVAKVTSGPDTGAETWIAVSDPLPATVQPVSDAEALRHGLTTDLPLYWVRYEGDPVRVGDGVRWNGAEYRVEAISRAPGIDTQLMIRYVTGTA